MGKGNYAQAGQDKFVLSLFDKDHIGVFVDVGCWSPIELNNTIRLEEKGWKGISIDILNLAHEWVVRKNPFICMNALEIDYQKLFNEHQLPKVIDYLSVDIEGEGDRFNVLKKVFDSDREYKVITIEHDSYRGLDEKEKIPQRKFLTEKGYVLVCSDIKLSGNPFEDWWVNPKYVSEENYKYLICNGLDAPDIIKMLKK